MKKHFLLYLLLFLGACQSGRAPLIADMQLIAENNGLWSAAVQVLKTDGVIINKTATTALHLREKVRENTNSVAADGSIGAYDISYTLYYQFGDVSEKMVQRNEIVDNDEGAYRASREQRRQVIDYLRRDALTQMLNALMAQQ